MKITYETHLILKENKLCPFKNISIQTPGIGNCNWHKNIEIALAEEGVGHVQYGGETLELCSDCIMVINSDVIHRFYCENGFVFTVIIIDDGFCAENGFDVEKLKFERCFFDGSTKELFLKATAAIDAFKNTQSNLDAAKARLAVLELLINITEHHTDIKNGKESSAKKSTGEYIKLAIKHISEHYTKPVYLDQISMLCGVTKYHFLREFKRFTGTTVCTYINLLRCQHAESCISEGMSITEAAFESGFDSLSYFSRTYKKLKGKLPSTIKPTPETERKSRPRKEEQI